MSLLSGERIKELRTDAADSLVITPLLAEDQIGPAGVDLRLSTEFKVSIQTREPLFGVVDRPIETFFQETHRQFGDSFVLYPNQLVLASTFEYIRLPTNLMGLIFTRSSFNRLGLQISSVVQPGYAGTLTLELTNKGENAIRLVTGMRIVQLMLLEVNATSGYLDTILPKYVGHIHPTTSGIVKDKDLEFLTRLNTPSSP